MVTSNDNGPRAHEARAPQAAGRAPAPATPVDESVPLRKAVNTLAIVPKSTRITTLARKTYNVLLHQAQDQGLEKDVFRAPLGTIIRGLDFDSNDQALIKKHLRAMVSTTVEWQSPTTGEGSSWNVSGLLAHARLSKEQGQVWVEWSYAVNLRQELLEPSVFARLRLEIISQLRSHASVALYEICTRYKEVGRTARQEWRWWVPVLSGNPPSEKSARLEYRIFKRDTLKPSIAEINAISDIDIELVEHKAGRAVGDIQFRIAPKRQASLGLTRPPQPVDMELVTRAQRLGIGEEVVESVIQEHGEPALRAALESLQRRSASSYPEPVRDPARYLRALLPAEVARLQRQAEEQGARAA
ncbi:MAG: replication initiation protein, partial [Burkholderiaceae bacterium]|nr:replication initiation protein [Burkholderiaceae bacterium]